MSWQLIATVIILLYLLIKSWNKNQELNKKIKSQSIIYGQSFEELIPFSNNFPYNYQDFKFLGKPIDGIVFDEDKIVFVEIKTGKSRLSEKQKKIKDLVERKKVYWKELS